MYHLRPKLLPHLIALTWQMSPRKPKLNGSCNGPLYVHSMMQNLYNRTCPRSWDNTLPSPVEKLSNKNCHHESINRIFCPTAHPPIRTTRIHGVPIRLRGKKQMKNKMYVRRPLQMTYLIACTVRESVTMRDDFYTHYIETILRIGRLLATSMHLGCADF